MANPRKGWSERFGPRFGFGRYRYVLTPWVWDMSVVEVPHWRLPDTSVGGVDLRPLAAQAIAGGVPQGFAFAATMQSVDGVAIATALHMADENATSAMQDAWQAGMGYRPQGAKLVDLLWDQLTGGSDPDGIDGPKPLMPGVDLQLKLFVGGHSLVKSEQFRFGIHPHTAKVRDLLRRDFERLWEETNGHDHCRRVLDFNCEKFRVADWREFVPQRLHAHVPGRLPHATTITESFNKADSDTLGPDLSWTELDTDWDVVSNEAQHISAGATGTARADSDLSSTDHYAQADVTVAGTGGEQAGVVCRKDGTATNTYYLAAKNTSSLLLRKRVSGTLTTLDTDAISVSLPDTVKVEANGSTINGYWNGAATSTATDTAITTGLRGGLYCFRQNWKFDNFEAADLGGGATDITVANAAHAHAATSPAITQEHAISPAAASHSHAATSPALTQTHVVSPDAAAHAHAATSPTLTQVHVVSPNSALHAHTASSPIVSTETIVEPNNALHAHAATSPAISQVHELDPNDASHAHAATSPAVSQVHFVVPSDGLHAHLATSPVVFVGAFVPKFPATVLFRRLGHSIEFHRGGLASTFRRTGFTCTFRRKDDD